MKCLDCGHSLSLNTKAKFKEWSCPNCSAKFAYISYFDNKISDYSKNKMLSDLSQAKVLSKSECLICRSRMVKILDFVKFNEIEACPKCKMIWLNGGELDKIQNDQSHLANTPLKVKMPSGFERPMDIQIGANDDYALGHSGSESFGQLMRIIINNTYLGSFSNKHPILGWFLAVILITLLFFAFLFFFRVFRLFDFFRIINRS